MPVRVISPGFTAPDPALFAMRAMGQGNRPMRDMMRMPVGDPQGQQMMALIAMLLERQAGERRMDIMESGEARQAKHEQMMLAGQQERTQQEHQHAMKILEIQKSIQESQAKVANLQTEVATLDLDRARGGDPIGQQQERSNRKLMTAKEEVARKEAQLAAERARQAEAGQAYGRRGATTFARAINPLRTAIMEGDTPSAEDVRRVTSYMNKKLAPAMEAAIGRGRKSGGQLTLQELQGTLGLYGGQVGELASLLDGLSDEDLKKPYLAALQDKVEDVWTGFEDFLPTLGAAERGMTEAIAGETRESLGGYEQTLQDALTASRQIPDMTEQRRVAGMPIAAYEYDYPGMGSFGVSGLQEDDLAALIGGLTPPSPEAGGPMPPEGMDPISRQIAEQDIEREQSRIDRQGERGRVIGDSAIEAEAFRKLGIRGGPGMIGALFRGTGSAMAAGGSEILNALLSAGAESEGVPLGPAATADVAPVSAQMLSGTDPRIERMLGAGPMGQPVDEELWSLLQAAGSRR